MSGVVQGFATIGLVIALGSLLGQLGVLDLSAQAILSRIAFYVASPALLLTTIGDSDVHGVLSRNLVATGAGVLVAGGTYAVAARVLWHRDAGSVVVGTLASSYVNAGNLGLPVAAYVLGDAALVAPTLLLQLLVLQPIALAVLDAHRAGRAPSVWTTLRGPLTNPLTLGTLVGVVLAATGWRLPALLGDPVRLVGAMAVPSMLVAYGIALRLGPGFGGDEPRTELVTTSLLKLAVQPLVAYAVAHLVLGVSGHALLAVVVTSALPTAQNIFIIASRYDRASTLARDTILVTTLGSVPVIALAVLLLT